MNYVGDTLTRYTTDGILRDQLRANWATWLHCMHLYVRKLLVRDVLAWGVRGRVRVHRTQRRTSYSLGRRIAACDVMRTVHWYTEAL
jgi:hypothetical protein